MTPLTNGAVRVMVADDQTLFRTGLARLLNSDPRVKVVAEAKDGFEAARMAGEVAVDVVLMDIKMPNLDGIKATEQIVNACPDTRVLILTSFDADSHVVDALRAGAGGYVLKDAEPETIIRSILAVHSGERVISPTAIEHVMSLLTGDPSPRAHLDGLTRREVEILKLIASGSPNKQIAFRLRISEKTVRNHISNIYQKLDMYDRSQAVLYAVRKGLVEV